MVQQRYQQALKQALLVGTIGIGAADLEEANELYPTAELFESQTETITRETKPPGS